MSPNAEAILVKNIRHALVWQIIVFLHFTPKKKLFFFIEMVVKAQTIVTG